MGAVQREVDENAYREKGRDHAQLGEISHLRVRLLVRIKDQWQPVGIADNHSFCARRLR